MCPVVARLRWWLPGRGAGLRLRADWRRLHSYPITHGVLAELAVVRGCDLRSLFASKNALQIALSMKNANDVQSIIFQKVKIRMTSNPATGHERRFGSCRLLER